MTLRYGMEIRAATAAKAPGLAGSCRALINAREIAERLAALRTPRQSHWCRCNGPAKSSTRVIASAEKPIQCTPAVANRASAVLSASGSVVAQASVTTYTSNPSARAASAADAMRNVQRQAGKDQRRPVG